MNRRLSFEKRKKLKSDEQVTAPNETTWAVLSRSIDSENSRFPDLDLECVSTALLSQTSLDHHANVVVADKNVSIINVTNRGSDDRSFAIDYKSLSKEPIVGSVVKHDWPVSS